MSDLALQIRYKSMRKETATLGCLAWLGIAAWAFFYLRPIVAAMPWFAVLFACLAGGLLFVYVPFVIVTAYREGGLLILNSDGVVFPASLFGFGPRFSLKWNQLKYIDCNAEKQPSIILQPANGFSLAIATKPIVLNDLARLLHALELWSPTTSWSSRAADFRDNIHSGTTGVECSFTKLWDEELRRRFNVTTFSPHEPGTRLRSGSLIILKQLAFGGFSAVYLAEDEHREKVVVKQLVAVAALEAKEKALSMFQREAMILARLDCSGIARVIDSFVEAGDNYLVLEHVDGENLREMVRRRGALNETEVLNLALQMVSILDYLHSQNPPLVHRDFTPDNMLLKASGQLILVDFGTVSEYVRSATGTVVGKQSYMPLEQIRGKAEPRTDLYALGGTLYFLLTGRDPEPLTECSGLNGRLGRIIQRLTQAEPESRFPGAREVELCLRQNVKSLC